MRRFALLVLALPACADEPGRYEAETVIALARSRGDAVGSRHTGNWNLMFSEIECSCDELHEPTDDTTVDGCLDPGLLSFFSMRGTEADGRMQLFAALPDGIATNQLQQALVQLLSPLDLLGPLDEDGTFAIGEVKTNTTTIGSGRVILRMDGTITDTPDPNGLGTRAELEAELFGFISGDALGYSYTCGVQYDIVGALPPTF
jgi:hypothetical protein